MKITSSEFVFGLVKNGNTLNPKIPQVVLYGRSNAGKSSTINKLTNRRSLARVSNTPGRTKEINVFLINKAWYLIDMPGYGYAKASKSEQIKLAELVNWFIEKSETNNRKSILLVDSKIGLTESDLAVFQILKEKNESILILLNKIDRLNQKELHQTLTTVAEQLPQDTVIISFSAKTGFGLDKLWKIIMGKKI